MIIEKTLPGLVIEKSSSGLNRYRVRPQGDRKRRITLTAEPFTKVFYRQYEKARRGVDEKSLILANERARRVAVSSVQKTGDLNADIRKILTRCKSRAGRLGRHFDLDETWFFETLERQQFRCALSGVVFDLAKIGTFSRRPNALSVDRVNCKDGYVKGNCRLTTVQVNTALSDFGDDVFIEMCRSVARSSGN